MHFLRGISGVGGQTLGGTEVQYNIGAQGTKEAVLLL